MLNAARAVRASWQVWRESRSARLSPPNNARRGALTAAIEPLGRAVGRLGDPGVLARLAAALPSEDMWKENGGARWNGRDTDLNSAMYPMRWRGLLVAESAGAAHLIDNCVLPGALWGWEVDDPTWQAALDAIDVAMAVRALESEGLPVTTGMAEAHRQVLEIATEQVANRA
jgi:hypothetical protein